jgi:hypothetical protein
MFNNEENFEGAMTLALKSLPLEDRKAVFDEALGEISARMDPQDESVPTEIRRKVIRERLLQILERHVSEDMRILLATSQDLGHSVHVRQASLNKLRVALAGYRRDAQRAASFSGVQMEEEVLS